MKNLTITSFLFALLVFTGACSSKPKDAKETQVQTKLAEEQAQVKTVKLTRTAFAREILTNGIVAATRKADLYFQTNEIVTNIFIKNGERVVKGQKIALLDLFKLNNALQQATDNLEKSKLELQNVLIGQGYALKDSARVPKDVMRIAKTRSNFENSRIQYEMTAYNLKNAVLYAPFNGVVANLFSKEQNQPANNGQPFCTIVDNAAPEVVFQVLESELALISTGDKVVVSPYSFGNYNAVGKIVEINPIVDKNGMVRVKASVQSPANKLYDGMNVNVRVQKTLPNQLVIPKKALVLRTNRQVVFTLHDGKAMWNYVKTGLENSIGFIVTEGLTEGDVVICDGNINLAHEAPVTVVK
jgi:membrane fusion protein (multidrug efflux system)